MFYYEEFKYPNTISDLSTKTDNDEEPFYKFVKKNSKLAHTNTQLQEENSIMSSYVGMLCDENSGLTSRIDRLTKANTSLQTDMLGLIRKNTELEAENFSVTEENLGLLDDVLVLKKSEKDLRMENLALESENLAVTEQNIDLLDQILVLKKSEEETRIRNLQWENAVPLLKIMKEQIERLESTLTGISELQARNEILERMNTDLSQNIRRLEEENAILNFELDSVTDITSECVDIIDRNY